MDTLAPFLHEFTYQAMANDLLDIEAGKSYRYRFASANAPGGYEERTATLSDNDILWTQVRHMHMKEAIDRLMLDFNKFLEENAGYRAGCASLYRLLLC
jgi:syntaxin-binding protein 1